MSPSIIARVKPPRGTCFVITPYREEFEELSTAICTAAGGPPVNLTGLRADALAKGAAFPQVVFDEIRSADLVVAVCTADGKTGQLNANVLYELGLASSLRKPILLLTTEADKDKLPSDVSHITYMVYDQSQVKGKSFQERLALEMTRVVQAASSRLTDRRFNDTYDSLSAGAGSGAAGSDGETPQLWRGLRKILELTRTVHQDLVHAQRIIQSLCESAHVLFGDPHQGITDFMMKWRQYKVNQANPLQGPLHELVDAYAEFLAQFPKFLDLQAPAAQAGPVQNGFKVQEFFDAVKHEVDEFCSLHQQVDRELNDLPGESSKERKGAAFKDSIQIPSTLDILMNDLYRLLWNVLGAVAKNVEAAIPAQAA